MFCRFALILLPWLLVPPAAAADGTVITSSAAAVEGGLLLEEQQQPARTLKTGQEGKQPQQLPTLLVANTRGDSGIYKLGLMSDGSSMMMAAPLSSPDSALVAPDHIVSRGGYYYISTGDNVENSAIARAKIEEEDDLLVFEPFATGGGLKRPYGFDFMDDILYVASFMTDQILMYDADTGEYMGVFAQGDATEEGLCNGPNQIEIYEDKLYMTTQGSYIDEEGNLNYAFSSHVVVYDLETGEGSVFIPQPDPEPSGLGFISMLGIKIGCGDDSLIEDDCTVYTTDFAGGLRTYALSDQTLLQELSTTYESGSSSGSLTLGEDGTVYVPGFTSDDSGVVMEFVPGADGMLSESSVIYGPEGELTRPIGILYV